MSSTILTCFQLLDVCRSAWLYSITSCARCQEKVFGVSRCPCVNRWIVERLPVLHTQDRLIALTCAYTQDGRNRWYIHTSRTTWQGARPKLSVSSNARSVFGARSLFRCTHSITSFVRCQELFSSCFGTRAGRPVSRADMMNYIKQCGECQHFFEKYFSRRRPLFFQRNCNRAREGSSEKCGKWAKTAV